MKKVRWGLIGPGIIANKFAQDIALTNNAVLQAVASRTKSRADAFAQKYSIPKAYGSYAELYEDADIDAIYIATPHTLHIEQTLASIAAGKSVLCEKPLTVNAQECKTVIQQAATSNVTVMEALWTYFLPAIQTAKNWYDQGRIGQLVQINSSFGYAKPFNAKERIYNVDVAGGCLLDMGIYPIAINWLFTQEEPQSIEVVSRFAPNGVEDDLAMLFNYQNNVSTLSTSIRARLSNWTHIIGTEGYIALPNSHCANECFLYKMEKQTDHFNDQRQGTGFEFQIQSVSDDILNGRKESAIMPLQNSLTLQKQMDAVRATFKKTS